MTIIGASSAVRTQSFAMARWVYERIDLSDTPRRGDEIDVLDALGEEGWELVAITPNHVAYLKREVASSRRSAGEAAQKRR